jgi:hypothetical protein
LIYWTDLKMFEKRFSKIYNLMHNLIIQIYYYFFTLIQIGLSVTDTSPPTPTLWKAMLCRHQRRGDQSRCSRLAIMTFNS